jgi:hypothetical protein
MSPSAEKTAIFDVPAKSGLVPHLKKRDGL